VHLPSSLIATNLDNDQKVPSQIQVAEIWQGTHGVTFCNKVHSCEICESLNDEPPLYIEMFSHITECPRRGKIGKASPAGYTQENSTDVDQGQGNMITSAWLGAVLVCSYHNCQRLLKTMRYFEIPYGSCLCDLAQRISWHVK